MKILKPDEAATEANVSSLQLLCLFDETIATVIF